MRNIGPSGLSALTLDQINNLEDTEFTDCVDILGAVNDYSTDQKVALATVGKRVSQIRKSARERTVTLYILRVQMYKYFLQIWLRSIKNVIKV